MYSAIESEFLLTARLQHLERELATLGPNARDHARGPRWSLALAIGRRATALVIGLVAELRQPAAATRWLA